MKERVDSKSLFSILIHQKKFLAAAAALIFLQCCAQLALPGLMADVVDRGVLRGDLEAVSGQGMAMILVCFIMTICGYLSHMSGEIAGGRFAKELRLTLYDHIYRLPVRAVEQMEAASLLTRMTNDTQIAASLVSVFPGLVLAPFFLTIGGTVRIWRISARLGYVFAGFLLCQILIMAVFIARTGPGFRKIRILTEKINRKLMLINARRHLIRQMNLQARESEDFEELNREMVTSVISVQRLMSLFQPIVMLIVDLSVGAVLLYAGNSTGNIQIGRILELLSYTQQILISIVVSGRLFQFLAEAEPSRKRIREILDIRTPGQSGTLHINGTFPGLSAREVSCSFTEGTGESYAVDGISLEIGRGEFLAVTGPVGCGKSTLAALLAGIYEPRSGEVLRGTEPLSAFLPEELHSKIAFVDKGTALLAGTIRDNLVFGRSGIREEDIRDALEIAGCSEFVNNLPQKLMSEAASMGKRISGGESQRLVIARALAGNPEVLILDDAVSFLDSVTERDLLDNLRRSRPELALVLFTQRAMTAMLADRTAYMENGRILCVGSPEELRERCAGFSRMISVEMGAGGQTADVS